MPVIGTLIDQFSRKYVYLNPDTLKGPGTWRLTNIPAVDDDGILNTIENLYAVAPIVNTQTGQTANLSFSIADVPDINSARSTRQLGPAVMSQLRSGNLVPTPYSSLFDLSVIRGVDPVKTNQVDSNAFVFFGIDGLPDIDSARAKRRMGVSLGAFGYNSRSVTAITAASPLKAVTAADIATVSFDLTTLPAA